MFLRLLLAILLAGAAPAAAQQTSQPDDQDQGFIDRLKGYLDKERQPTSDRPEEPEGFYPRIGGLTTGSGLALGGGYRNHLFGDAFYGDLSGVVSLKRYVGLDARLRLPSPLPRLELWTNAAYRHYPEEDYYGLGAASLREERANYGIDSVDVGAEAIYKLTPALHVGASFGYFSPTVEPGADENYPSIEQRFTEASAPGLVVQPDFLHYGVFGEFDTRDVRGNPRRGGLYHAVLSQWNDRGFNAYDFRRFDLEARHYVPVRGPRHVVATRAGLSYVNNDLGERVPFYVFPYVGGANSVRSFDEFRFRDENAMFISAEYRFGVHEYVQLVGFADAGKVASRWQDINLRDLKKGYGVGVRAGTANRTFVRLDIGTGGGEGTKVFLKFMPGY